MCDSRGQGGPRFLYRLTIRRPHPDFSIRVTDMNPTVNAGSGKRFKLQADRFDEFDGDIRLDITGLPPGFAVSTPLVIQAGHLEAVGVLSALAWAPQPTPENAAASKITATARIDGHEVTKVVGSLGQIKLAAEPPLIARLEPTTSSSVATSGRSPHDAEGDPALGRARSHQRTVQGRRDADEAGRPIGLGRWSKSGERFVHRRRHDRRQEYPRRAAGSFGRQKPA